MRQVYGFRLNLTVSNYLEQNKTIRFASHQTRIVRDVYTTSAGIGATSGTGYLGETFYFMESGASWHGKIGEAQILVRFPQYRRIRAYHNSLDGKLPESVMRRRGTVLYDGFGKPHFGRNWILFKAKELKPTPSDNIYVRYHWQANP